MMGVQRISINGVLTGVQILGINKAPVNNKSQHTRNLWPVTAWKEAKKNTLKKNWTLLAVLSLKNKSIPADRAEICWLSDKDGDTHSLICIIAPCTKILKSAGQGAINLHPQHTGTISSGAGWPDLSGAAPPTGKPLVAQKGRAQYSLLPSTSLALSEASVTQSPMLPNWDTSCETAAFRTLFLAF